MRVNLGFFDVSFYVFFNGFVKSDEKQFWGTAGSLQRVIKDVSGFANPEMPEPSTY